MIMIDAKGANSDLRHVMSHIKFHTYLFDENRTFKTICNIVCRDFAVVVNNIERIASYI